MNRLLADVTNPSIMASFRITTILTAVFILVGLVEIIPAVGVAARDTSGDLGRQWVVTQYVIHRVNPFPVALDALRAQYGVLAPQGPVHMLDTQVYAIPKSGPHPQTNPEFGPPEATYSPASVMTLVPLGFLPRDAVRFVWLLMNVALLLLVARELKALTGTGEVSFFFFLGLVAIWPASASCIEREQFSLLCLGCILSARRLETTHPITAGLLYSLSMVKPSLSIPFLFLPLLDRSVKTLASLATSQLVLLGAMSWLVRADPFHLTAEWLSVAAYFRQGRYSIQDIINKLRLDGSAWDILLQLCILIAGGVVASRFGASKKIAFLAVISCIWTYHALYDFVALLIPAALLVVLPIDRRSMFHLAALVIVGFGLTAAVYSGTGGVTRGMREAARLGLVALVVGVAWSEFQPRRPDAAFAARISPG
jgi:hypothetical protein